MARYNVFLSPSGNGYVLDVQSDLLDRLKTRAVVPLVPYDGKVKLVRQLNPVFQIEGNRVAMFTQLIVTIPIARLAEPRTNLLRHHDEIVAALDMLLQGF